jgi:15-cis-phytoene synthase
MSAAMTDAYDYCAERVRLTDKDRYLAALFVPAEPRRHVLALLAFSAEIARVRDLVSDPLPGEVRLQWWRDLLEGRAHGAADASPLAQALVDTIERFSLPREALVNLIEARIFDLYDDPMPTLHDLEGYCGETCSALIQLSSIVLAGGTDPGTAVAAGHGGVAYALVGLMRSMAFHASRGQVFLPEDVLQRHGASAAGVLAGTATPEILAALADVRAAARQHLARLRELICEVPAVAAPAFLPCALVQPMLDRMDRHGYDPYRDAVDMPQWLKQWHLWRAAAKSRCMR